MWPLLLHTSSYDLGTYGVVVGIGLLLSLWVARRLGVRDGLPPKRVNDIGLGVFAFGFAGAKLLGFLVAWTTTPQPAWEALRSAGAIHGGLFGALLGIVLLTRLWSVPLGPLLDAYVPAAALGQGIGRLGCFAAGCCFGGESSLPWAVSYSDPMAAHLGGVPLHVSLHPVQIYDALAHGLLFLVLVLAHRRSWFRYRLISVWAITEGLCRFSLEAFRGDLGRGTIWGIEWLSTGRLTAGLLCLLGIALLTLGPRTDPHPAPGATRDGRMPL